MSEAMLKFGRSSVNRFVSVRELVTVLVRDCESECGSAVNYSLLMPLVLFLHCVTTPDELLAAVVEEYRSDTATGTESVCVYVYVCVRVRGSDCVSFNMI